MTETCETFRVMSGYYEKSDARYVALCKRCVTQIVGEEDF